VNLRALPQSLPSATTGANPSLSHPRFPTPGLCAEWIYGRPVFVRPPHFPVWDVDFHPNHAQCILHFGPIPTWVHPVVVDQFTWTPIGLPYHQVRSVSFLFCCWRCLLSPFLPFGSPVLLCPIGRCRPPTAGLPFCTGFSDSTPCSVFDFSASGGVCLSFLVTPFHLQTVRFFCLEVWFPSFSFTRSTFPPTGPSHPPSFHHSPSPPLCTPGRWTPEET